MTYGWFDRKRILGLVGQRFDGRYQYDTYMYPMICSDDPNAEVIAHFLTTDAPAITVKECDGFTSILHSGKFLKNEVLRETARFAGCHIYNEADDTLYANKNYLTIHSSKTERKHLKFKEPVTVTEVYEGKRYGEGVTEIEFDMYIGETKMFRIER